MKASDIMTKNVISAPPDMTVKEVAKLLFNKHISGLPIVDKDMRVIGIVTEKELISMAMPEYLASKDLRDFAYILDEEPFKKNIAKSEKLFVKDIMRKDVRFITEDVRVPEIARLMLSNNLRRLPVVRNGKLVGIVARADIVKEIAKEVGII